MKKFTSIDYLRAFSMLYIVGYWHLFDYVAGSQGNDGVVMSYITHTVLALFVFISGFLLGGKSTRAMSAKQFYLRRLLRIYPLYALAVAIFYLYGIHDGWLSGRALFALSMFYEPAPLTLWFVTMLVLFYLVAPVLLMLVDRVAAFATLCAALMVATIGFLLVFNTVDPRVLLYFPSFCLGMVCANHGVSSRLVNPLTAGLGLGVGVGLTFVSFGVETLNYLKEVPLVAGGAYLIFYAAWRNEWRLRDSALVSFLSYSSFASYLFHRPIFNALQDIYIPTTPIWQTIYLQTVGLLVVGLVSWSLQKSYDYAYAAVQGRLQPAAKMAA